MTYREALDYIASLEPRGWRLGLDRMAEFAHRAGLDDALGIGSETPRFIHVAGTNGKGSTTAYLQSILHESGYRTGSFFSPYVYDPRERIQLGRELIPEAILAGLTAMLIPVAEEFTETEFGGISEFEFKTGMAFLFFKRLKCEWVALEVGLGGRLDATNIVTPQCSVVVSIGLDHTGILGSTIEEIAREKAGIIKSGVPVVVGRLPDAALAIVESEAKNNGSTIWRFGQEITIGHDLLTDTVTVTTPHGRHAGLKLGIPGSMQPHNLALAVAACDLSGATRTLGGLQRGAANATIPGRFEVRIVEGKTVILDGAHNSDAAQVLLETLKSSKFAGRRVLLLTAMVAGHDPVDFFKWFSGEVARVFLVPMNVNRAIPPSQLETSVAEYFPEVSVFAGLGHGVAAALAETGPEDVLLVTGSFYLVGEVGRVFAGATPAD